MNGIAAIFLGLRSITIGTLITQQKICLGKNYLLEISQVSRLLIIDISSWPSWTVILPT